MNLENINILFSCLKKLDCNQSYYELIANCLPDISIDFIPDGPDGKLLNKVINEFLVNQNNNNVEFFAVIMHKVRRRNRGANLVGGRAIQCDSFQPLFIRRLNDSLSAELTF